MFNEKDAIQIREKGMILSEIEKQIEHFRSGFPFIELVRPAVTRDGIMALNNTEMEKYVQIFVEATASQKIVKFVPASGAASRMFKHLFEFSGSYSAGDAGDQLFNKDQGFNSVHYFIYHLQDFAFYTDLMEVITSSGLSIENLINSKEYGIIINHLLSVPGLDYANLPKALLKFHDYPDGGRTAAEEHLVEAAEYARDRNGIARIHFTISPEHREKFMALFAAVQAHYESTLGIHFDITFSIQKSSTDTLAVDENNQPVRNPDNTLLFRPGGHGALLENLNELDADLIFIKNIDNIVPDRLKEITFRNKKLLGGYLLSLRETIFGFLRKVRDKQSTSEDMRAMIAFARESLYIDIPEGFSDFPEETRNQVLFSMLNRPIRVCGMVRNEGEPGGGPFWVKGTGDSLSLQIVEASQINVSDPVQKSLLAASTHFNPVDLVCSTRDFEGNKFDLREFVDENTGFISLKSSGGKTLKAQELPGLWNGSMARWITIFVEVPIITFNPVKTVNDLLRREHLIS